jgi:hypothetical protein
MGTKPGHGILSLITKIISLGYARGQEYEDPFIACEVVMRIPANVNTKTLAEDIERALVPMEFFHYQGRIMPERRHLEDLADAWVTMQARPGI